MTPDRGRRALLLVPIATLLRGWVGGHWTLTGTVVDKRRQPVASAAVTLVNTLTRKARAAQTDRRGYFNFDGLSDHSEYEVTARSGQARAKTQKVAPLANKPVVLIEIELLEA